MTAKGESTGKSPAQSERLTNTISPADGPLRTQAIVNLNFRLQSQLYLSVELLKICSDADGFGESEHAIDWCLERGTRKTFRRREDDTLAEICCSMFRIARGSLGSASVLELSSP